MPGIMPLRPQKYMTAPFSRRSKISSAYSSTCVRKMSRRAPRRRRVERRAVDASPAANQIEATRGRRETNLVLDVHLAALLVLLLARERVVDAEVVRELGLGRLPLLVVEEGVAVGDAEEEPGEALVGLAGRRRLREEAADEAAVRRDARAGRDHDVVRVRLLLGHEHDLARRACAEIKRSGE